MNYSINLHLSLLRLLFFLYHKCTPVGRIPANAIQPPRAGEYRRMNAPFYSPIRMCNHKKHHAKQLLGMVEIAVVRGGGGEYRRINAPWCAAAGANTGA